MSIKPMLFFVASMLIVQPVLADDEMTSNNTSCATIVKSCLDAGFTSTRLGNEGKQFWKDCMKPILLNKTAEGVTVDAKDAASCRAAKIVELKNELAELQNVK